MTVTVPATDVGNNALQAEIAAVSALVTSNVANGAQAMQFSQALAQLQMQLVTNLMANAVGGAGSGSDGGGSVPSRLSPSAILAACTINT
jgi:hypothetical protein